MSSVLHKRHWLLVKLNVNGATLLRLKHARAALSLDIMIRMLRSFGQSIAIIVIISAFNSQYSCEYYHSQHNRLHFVDYFPNEGSVDIDYLEALFDGDPTLASDWEHTAQSLGYGPLAECTTVSNFSSQRIVCRAFSLFLARFQRCLH
jgi:hypothetical protein